MKRAFAILLVLTMAISMVSCGSANSSNESLQNQTVPGDGSTAVADNNAQTEDSTDSQNEDDSQAQGMDDPDVPGTAPPEPETSEQSSKILVAYFSRVGNTV